MRDVVLFEELSAGDKVIGVADKFEKSWNALSLAMAEKLLSNGQMTTKWLVSVAGLG